MLKFIGKRLKESYKREQNISTEEWARKNVYFSGTEISPITGAFNVKYSPHLKFLFKLSDRPEVHKLFGKWASQSAKSLFEMIIIGKRLDTEPTNVLYMQPLKDDIPKIVDIKVDPILKCMPKLWNKFKDYKVKENIRGKREIKKLAGGSLIISGSSVKERKSLTIPMLVMDEIGEFEDGSVVEASERTKAFSKFFPKIVGVSTIVHPKDEICTNFDECEAKVEWRYICPSCEDNFYPEPETLKWKTRTEFCLDNGITESDIVYRDYLLEAKRTAHVECPHCAYKINSKEKDEMILNGGMDWFFIEGDDTATSYGADMNSLGSYFVSLEMLVENIVSIGDDTEKLSKIWRGWFNRFYEVQHEKTNENDLLLLSSGLKRWEVPEGTFKLYMGVDTQATHFWYEIKAYCFGNVSYTIAWGRVETFAELEDIWIYGQNLEGSNGERFIVSKMGIDRRGYNQNGVRRTDEVDEFVQYMVSKYKNGDENRIYATEGHSSLTGDKPFMITTAKDVSSNRVKNDLKIIKTSNLYMKNKLNRSIERAIMKAKAETEHDEGYLYEANLFYIDEETIEADMKGTDSKSYTRQYTAEVYDYWKNPKTGKIDAEKSWFNPKQADNHLFDTGVICEVFSEIDKLSLKKETIGK